MDRFDIWIEPATPAAIAPFGHLVAPVDGVPIFAQWDGAVVHGPIPIEIGSGGELLLVTLAAKPFPVQCGLIERHFEHTQTYLPTNAKPFVLLLGLATDNDVPDYVNLRAFLFDGSAGIVMHRGIWHDFPYALEDDTRFSVVLRQEAHRNDNASPTYAMDADGPDLQRREMKPRAIITVHSR